MQSNEVPLPLSIHPSQPYRALSLDEADHLRLGMLRRDRDQHVHVVSQLLEHFAEVRPQLLIQRLSTALGMNTK